MNAIISLCHFCEVHGPSVVLCTQAFHAPQSCEETEVFIHESSSDKQKSGPNSLDSLLVCRRANDLQVQDVASSAPSSSNVSMPICPETMKADVCEACVPFTGGRLGFISHDTETQFSYVTKHHPQHQEVYSIVRHACLRSLSCEISPDPNREGPIFFGDEHRSQVLSYTFTVKDSLARGLQRMYSVTVVMMDKTFLLNSWPFLVKHIRQFVEDLKKKANGVFNEEVARHPNRCNNPKPFMVTTSSSYRMLRGTRKHKPTRSLAELTGDKLIFNRLHSVFTWMLKAGGVRLTERLLEGPPTEGCLLDSSRIEETEEGFVKVYSKVGMTVDVKIHCRPDPDQTPAATFSTLFSQLKKFARLLGRERFHVVAHHILIGNQVVVRSPCKLIAHTILDCLKILLPKGCCHIEYYSDVYIQSYKYNFLGVKPSVKIPLNTSLCILIDVVMGHVSDVNPLEMLEDVTLVPDKRTPEELESVHALVSESTSGPHSLLVRVGSSEEIVDLSAISYNVLHAPKLLPSKEPSLLDKIERVLFSDSFADSVAERSLQCLKDDWMMKVKRMFMFIKFGESRSAEEMAKFSNVIGASEDDKVALKFCMSGLSGVEYQLTTDSTPIADTSRLTHHLLA